MTATEQTYRFVVKSGSSVVRGLLTVTDPLTNDQITTDLLDQAEVMAAFLGQPWDPYNVSVAFRLV